MQKLNLTTASTEQVNTYLFENFDDGERARIAAAVRCSHWESDEYIVHTIGYWARVIGFAQKKENRHAECYADIMLQIFVSESHDRKL